MKLDDGSKLLLSLLASQLVIILIALFQVWLSARRSGDARGEAGRAKRLGRERQSREGSDARR